MKDQHELFARVPDPETYFVLTEEEKNFELMVSIKRIQYLIYHILCAPAGDASMIPGDFGRGDKIGLSTEDSCAAPKTK